MKAIISNGFGRFHLASLASELAKQGALSGFFTGAWPFGWRQVLAERFPRRPAWTRLRDRWEPIDERLVRSFLGAELLWLCGGIMRTRSVALQRLLETAAFRLYALQAKIALDRRRLEIYHYRSCFGLSSVPKAKRLGAIALCDHSIAHPQSLSYLVANEGKVPPPGGVAPDTPLERLMARDLMQADHVLVNSDFVKATCLHAGMEASHVHVIYLGVDDKFLEAIPPFDIPQIRSRETERLLYAGAWDTRKGAWTVLRALKALTCEWSLNIAGGIEPTLACNDEMKAFFGLPQVKTDGVLPRARLAREMTKHAVFVFPSLCEGSARVVFEAMACGCYIVTTPNSGTIVKDGIHGRLIPPGDVNALSEAIEWAMAHPLDVAEIGWRNSQLVRAAYRQRHYGEKVLTLYSEILGRE